MAHEVSPRPHPREMDMLLSTGERISCALAAMVINDLGHEAISLTGSQAGIVTDTSHTKAKIIDVRTDRVEEALDDGRIVLVAGFQGTSAFQRAGGGYEIHGNVTTLGRGGSDTTAVAIAAALGADVCEIFTDVAGVFTRRPADRARRAQARAGVVRGDARDVGLRRRRAAAALGRVRAQPRRRIHCRSSLEDGPGTFVLMEQETMERPLVTAVTHSTDEARVTLTGVPDTPGVAGRVFTALAEANVNVDMIIQNEPETEGQRADMSFTVPQGRRGQRGRRAAAARRPSTAWASRPIPTWARSRSSARE